MKQIKQTQIKNHTIVFSGNKQNCVSFITILFLALFILNPFCGANAQNKLKPIYKLGGGVETFVSGNWHGAFYAPYLSIGDGKNFFSAAPLIQKRSMLVHGAKIGYSRILTGGELNNEDYEGQSNDGTLQLNFFCYAQYLNQLPLSYAAVRIEELTHTKSDLSTRRDWSSVRLSTTELCAGFELHVKITKNISWKNYVGSSVYYHLNYIKGMYHSKVAPVLVLGTGICIKHF